MLTAIIFLITMWFLFGGMITYAIMTTLLTVEWIILILLGTLLIFSTLGWIFYLLEDYQPKFLKDKVVLSKEELNHKNYEIAYHTEREEMAKTAMFTLRQDTVNEIVELLKEKDYKELADLIKTEFSVKARKYTVESLIANANKEKAEKIFQRLFEEHEPFNDNDVIVVWQVKEVLTKIAKEFGLEIKE